MAKIIKPLNVTCRELGDIKIYIQGRNNLIKNFEIIKKANVFKYDLRDIKEELI